MPGYGARKMPSPRQYVAILVAWIVLILIAGIGQQARRAATAVGWTLVVTGLVVGPFGKRLIGLFNNVAQNLPSSPGGTGQIATSEGTTVTTAVESIGSSV